MRTLVEDFRRRSPMRVRLRIASVVRKTYCCEILRRVRSDPSWKEIDVQARRGENLDENFGKSTEMVASLHIHAIGCISLRAPEGTLKLK